MVEKLKRDDLYSLERYAAMRAKFRAKLIEHKRKRIVKIGDHATLHFEDRLTMHYQIQEMLRAERIFESGDIQEELDAYNPLIPDGTNFKATFMIEYVEEEERKKALAELIGIEDKVWVKIDGHESTFAIADEDLERETEQKTSSVHFVRFELTPGMIEAAKQGAPISIGIDHDKYRISIKALPQVVRDSLVADLD